MGLRLRGVSSLSSLKLVRVIFGALIIVTQLSFVLPGSAFAASPSDVGSVVLLLLSAGVALLAYAYRQQLPKSLRQSWYRHHGLYKAAGMMSLVVALIALYGGGQI